MAPARRPRQERARACGAAAAIGRRDLNPLAKDRTARSPVFTTDGRVGIGGFSKMKAMLDASVVTVLDRVPAARDALGGTLEPWVVHDLRRTLATGCQAMGVAIEAILNHISGRRGGIAGVYQTYDYFDEKADALAKWANLVDTACDRWKAGDVAGILELDPVRSAHHRRRARREQAGEGAEK